MAHQYMTKFSFQKVNKFYENGEETSSNFSHNWHCLLGILGLYQPQPVVARSTAPEYGPLNL
jgi:hypothetical protein